MGCNPDEGKLREITDEFTKEDAVEKGFKSFFEIGEIIKIKNCYFEVNNFIEEHAFMNLKLISNDIALERISSLITQAEGEFK